MSYGAKHYKQMQVTTATPGQILLMLYEAAIKYVKKASVAMDKNDLKEKGINIGKAHDILNELTNTLNHEVGGDIARNLEQLYNFMCQQLMKANMENKKEYLDPVVKNLETLLDGWRSAIEQIGKKGP